MTTITVAAVQASYVLMDRTATLDKVEALLSESKGAGGRPGRLPRGLPARHADLDRRDADLGR